VFNSEQLTKAAKLAEEIELSPPWTVVVSRDKRKAQVLDGQGISVFGGSWTLTPEQAENIVAVRMLFPVLLKSLLTNDKLASTLMETILQMKPIFDEFSNWTEVDVWANKGLALISEIEKG
jgi:hypothetical protein